MAGGVNHGRFAPMTRSLAERDLRVLWHPCAQMQDYADFPPLEIVGAAGVHLHLADGTRVIDAISSWWCKSLGHRHPRLTAALKSQADAFEHVLLANTTSEPVVALCEELLALANGGAPSAAAPLAKVFLSGDGSTGIEVALKLAVQFQRQSGAPQRTRFANLANGYHGESVATMSVSDCGLYRAPFADLCFASTVLAGVPERSGPGDPRWDDCAAEWPAIAAQLAPVADTLAAVIVEPLLQGAGGMRLYSPDLLRRLRTWCDAHGVLLIADEIAAGMGRLGTVLAEHRAGILADLVVLSKGLTGGYLPLAATLCTQRLYDAFLGPWSAGCAFLHSNTYSGNALAAAVAREALAVYRDEDVLGNVARVGPRLRLPDLPWLTAHRGCGMMAAADLARRDGTPFPAAERTGYRVYRAAVRRGALLRNLGDTLYLFPPLITDAATVDRLHGILADSVREVCGAA